MRFWSNLASLLVIFGCLDLQDSQAISLAMTTRELATASDQVLLATVTEVVQPDPVQWILEVHLRVEDSAKGAARKGEEYLYKIPGGTVRGRGLFVSETPRPLPGDKIIVFLRESESELEPYVGGDQGCLEVEDDLVAGKGVYVDSYMDYIRRVLEEEKGRQERE